MTERTAWPDLKTVINSRPCCNYYPVCLCWWWAGGWATRPPAASPRTGACRSASPPAEVRTLAPTTRAAARVGLRRKCWNFFSSFLPHWHLFEEVCQICSISAWKTKISYTDKKEKEIFLIFKEIQMGSVAKSYVRKGFLDYEEIRIYLIKYGEAISHMTVQPLHSECPYIWDKFYFFISVPPCYEVPVPFAKFVKLKFCSLHSNVLPHM